MTVSYKELLKQREALEQQITEARRRELTAAISQVRELVAEYGLTQQDVFPAGRTGRVSGKTMAVLRARLQDPRWGIRHPDQEPHIRPFRPFRRSQGLEPRGLR